MKQKADEKTNKETNKETKSRTGSQTSLPSRGQPNRNNKDALTKVFLQSPNVFADLCNHVLYDGQEVVRPENLHEMDTTAISVPYGSGDVYLTEQRYRDVLKHLSVKTDDRVTYLILGVENQTETHYAMPVRNMIYDAQQYGKQIAEATRSHAWERRRRKEEVRDPGEVDVKAGKPNSGEFLSGFWKTDKLMPVITLVLYFSAAKWDGPLTLYDMLTEQDETILSYVSDYKVNLVSPAGMTDADICKFRTDLREVLLYIKYSADEDKLIRLLEEEKQRFEAMSREGFRAMNVVTGSKLKYMEENGVVNVCKAIEDMRTRSRNEGRNEGIEEGRTKERKRMNRLNEELITANRLEDLARSTVDTVYQNQLMKEYGIN